jgi:chorismate mutase
LQVTIITFGLLLIDKPSFGQYQENSQRMQLVVSQASQVTPYQQQQVDRLLNLIRQRLLIQNDVARWKWNQNSAIEAPEREQALLAQIRKQAPAYGLDPDAAVVFFQWQLFAGKLLQVDDFQTWQREGIQFFDNVPDLNQTLRPSLDKLSPEILSALAPLFPALSCPTLQQLIQSRAQIILRGDAIDDTVRRIAIAPLIELKGSSCRDVSRHS